MSCAHQRAPEYYAESVYPGNENNFLGIRCGSLSALNSNYCPGNAFPMGYATPHNLKGNYFLKTNDESPYGLNATKNFQPKCNENGQGSAQNASNLRPVRLRPDSSSNVQNNRLRFG